MRGLDRGVDFVGQVVKPWYRRIRPRVVHEALARTRSAEDPFVTANSYFGLFREAPASRRDRALLAKVVMQRGHAVNRSLTKAYRT